MLARVVSTFLLSLSLVSAHSLAIAQQSCTALNSSVNKEHHHLKLLNVTWVSAGSLDINSQSNNFSFCRVLGNITYAKTNYLGFELWLPDEQHYANRYASVGNSAFGGAVDTSAMMARLNEGFAVAGSDSGHLAVDNSAASGQSLGYVPFLNNKEETLAWIHDSVHSFSRVAKDLTKKFYKTRPKHSYFFGCSTGGAQGFALAQRHPHLFDGIYAGSPGFWYSHLMLSFLWNSLRTTGSGAITQSSLDTINAAVLERCDTLDGVRDGVLEDPLKCDFDLESVACQNDKANRSSCLADDQIAAAKAFYIGPRDVRNGHVIYPGFSVGSELGWLLQGSLANIFAIPVLQNLVFPDAKQNLSFFNFGTDVDKVDNKAGVLIDDNSTDLRKFKRHRGKLIVTQGWADPYNAAELPIQYFEAVKRASWWANATDCFNLFMIPGGGHCGSASAFPNVPATYHVSDALVEWVETGKKPSYILSTGPPNGSNSSRKLCPWPQTARYDGSDQNDYASYTCSI